MYFRINENASCSQSSQRRLIKSIKVKEAGTVAKGDLIAEIE